MQNYEGKKMKFVGQANYLAEGQIQIQKLLIFLGPQDTHCTMHSSGNLQYSKGRCL